MGTATVGTVLNSGIVLVDSLAWGSRWVSAGEGATVITVGYTPGATLAELAAMTRAMDAFEKVINVDFQWIGADSNRNADIRFVVESGAPAGLLGVGYAPGEFWLEPIWNPGLSEIHVFRNNFSGSLAAGGFDFITFIHELGHAMGLAHPHDNGGTWLDKSLVFPGVTPGKGFGDFGDFNLNQGIFTTMSYNNGWQSSGVAGYQASLMALDIMALQYIYGANTTYAAGDNAYVLATRGGFTCLWDTGGTDAIAFAGRQSCTIDLRAATGLVEEGGGGYVSFVTGGKAGFTIAVGVVVENAIGGSGADHLTGNAAANRLTGGLGTDVLTGGRGEDSFIFARIAESRSGLLLADRITDFDVGIDTIDLSAIDGNARLPGIQDFVWNGAATVFTAAGEVRFEVVNGRTHVLLNTDLDQQAEAMIILDGVVSLTDSDFIF